MVNRSTISTYIYHFFPEKNMVYGYLSIDVSFKSVSSNACEEPRCLMYSNVESTGPDHESRWTGPGSATAVRKRWPCESFSGRLWPYFFGIKTSKTSKTSKTWKKNRRLALGYALVADPFWHSEIGQLAACNLTVIPSSPIYIVYVWNTPFSK